MMPNTAAIRKDRRTRAEKRQAEYDKLSTEEKLARLPPKPHAEKQRAKLLRRLESEYGPKRATGAGG